MNIETILNHLHELASVAANYRKMGKPDAATGISDAMVMFIKVSGFRDIAAYDWTVGTKNEQDRRMVADMIRNAEWKLDQLLAKF